MTATSACSSRFMWRNASRGAPAAARSSITWKRTVVFPARRGPTRATTSGVSRNGASSPVIRRRTPESSFAVPQRFQRVRT
jgi:hypothetical protein